MHAINTPIYQREQIREFARLANERFGITNAVLMQRAGKAAFDFLMRRWPQVKKIAVFCGGGNNGGDGYVLAELAQARGIHVTIWQVGSVEHLSPESMQVLKACKKASITIEVFNETVDLHHPDLIVDAICGIGLKNDVRENIITVIEKIERAQVPVYALDMPSGIDADTGQVLGTALHANATITFIGLKLGLFTGQGSAYSGEVICSDLQLPEELFGLIEPSAKKIHLNSYASLLKPRSRDWHKKLSGHVLIVGGDLGYAGAPRMAAEAAYRVGAGLVSVATRIENSSIINVNFPEIMCHGIQDMSALDPLLKKADVIVLGPGLGQSDWSKQIWDYLIHQEIPMVVDADGLNLLSQSPCAKETWVLTPHPGEAGRLLNTSTEQVQQDRLGALKAMHHTYGGVCVLKGSGSLILSTNALPALCDKGNPGMASAGMGDVLSGVIGGLIAQHIPLTEAAKLGVCLHAMAGDLAAKQGERGMIATDLIPHLRRLVNYANSANETQ